MSENRQHAAASRSHDEGMDEDTPLAAVTLPTPAGPLAVLLDEDGVVRSAGFGTVEQMAARLPEQVRLRGHRVVDPAVADLPTGVAVVVEAVRWYSAGGLDALDQVRVAQPGGPFQQRAWQAMRAIAPGQVLTYQELAAESGNPAAVRAAGSACARNLVAPFVPCHRVVRSDGSLGGYYYGLATKDLLLAHERGLSAP